MLIQLNDILDPCEICMNKNISCDTCTTCVNKIIGSNFIPDKKHIDLFEKIIFEYYDLCEILLSTMNNMNMKPNVQLSSKDTFKGYKI